MTLGEALRHSSTELANSGVPEPTREAILLVTLVTGKDRAFVAAHPEYELSAIELGRYAEYLRRRSAREPYQYISGKQEFFGLEFEVTPDVLIPRPETELLVDGAIKILGIHESPRFLEIGVGTGCISISVLSSLPVSTAVAVDVSPAALEIAHRNAIALNVDDRLELRLSSVFDSIGPEKFDAILTNPPYVPAADIASLQAEVRDHEPHLALDGGSDGLDIVKQIITGASSHLRPGGALLIEIGFDQSTEVLALFDLSIWRTPLAANDLQGIPRCIIGTLR